MKKKTENVLLFDRSKYILVIVGLMITIVGFVLMTGGGSDNPNEFSDQLFNFRRITLAPILVLAGFGLQIYAILKRTTQADESVPTKKK